MSDNLLFSGISEEKEETPANCANKVLKLIEDEMEFENASSTIKIKRAHRLGKFIICQR